MSVKLVSLCQFLAHMNEGNTILSVFIDLKRGFKTIDGNTFLKKWETYDVRCVNVS